MHSIEVYWNQTELRRIGLQSAVAGWFCPAYETRFYLLYTPQVKIEYLDGREITDAKKLTQHEFGPENAMTSLTLLYRPGHYDILYPTEG